MIQPCSNTTCLAPCDEPLANLSAEDEDFQVFLSESFVAATHEPFTPKIGKFFSSTGCLGICTSTVSQEEADICAQNQVALCDNNNNPGTRLFSNTPQSCTVFCPDGSPFTFTVAAGVIITDNQDTANTAAHQLACRLAAQRKICFGPLVSCACVDQQYSVVVAVTGGQGDIQYSIFDGELPPGLFIGSVQGGFSVFGIPTLNGTYPFTVQGVDSQGNFMRKSYSITVLEITTTALDPFTIGTPYTFQLQAAGGSGQYLWKIVSGTLPPGLSMNNSGVISGTPT